MVILGQTEAWADRRLQGLSGKQSPKFIEVSEASPIEVKEALLSSPRLSWLAFQEDAITALTNLRTLAWVMRAEGVFEEGSMDDVSIPAIADRLWEHWTDKKIKLQSFLMKMAEREANFERSFAINDLDLSACEALDESPKQFPLRKIEKTNRIEFEHDLAADWARFQYLKTIAGDTAKWPSFANNPLWHNALRMLGQFLLRDKTETGTKWDTAFDKAEKAKKTSPLAIDILLDALCLDPLAENYLNERKELLLKDDGALLNRLLNRFHHIATAPVIPKELLDIDPSLKLYLEANYRTPIYGRWPQVIRFLSNHKQEIADLISPVVSKVCETWLTTTPMNLASGELMPYRTELAELAIATARSLQIAQGKRIMFLDNSETPIYAGAFSASMDVPDEIIEWALEMARRKPYRKDITEALTAFKKQKAEEHKERLRTDIDYRKRRGQMRS